MNMQNERVLKEQFATKILICSSSCCGFFRGAQKKKISYFKFLEQSKGPLQW